ncbi:MAG: NUDIX hydrolase [Corynebacterium sp.]|nr:NUDIX hydrolase [Corynebacterium sp.]
MSTFQVESSKLLVNSPIMAMRQDQVRMPDGSLGQREIIEHFGAVAVVAHNEGKIALFHQYRHALGRHLWELPAGLLDFQDEEPLVAAKRELQEEVGLASNHWSHLIDVAATPGFCDEVVRIFVADSVFTVERPPAEAEEADAERAMVDLTEAQAMIWRGEIVNATAIAGILAFAHVQAQSHAPGLLRPADSEFELRPTALAQRRVAAGVRGDLKKLGHAQAR